MWITHAVSNDDCELAGDACRKDIRLGGCMVTGFTPGDAHVAFLMVNGTFYNGSDLVKRNPFR